jgi:peptidoglycan/LPS O-acetylase OafA/YrhL
MAAITQLKINSIQHLRALAVLMVIVNHYELGLRGGFIGVDIFFVISGFVITQSISRLQTENSWKLWLYFCAKRISRLLPTFLFVSLILIGIIFLLYPPNLGIQQNAFKSAIGATLGISNFVLPKLTGDYFEFKNENNPFLHTWSLSVEEQFYFFLPLLFVIIIKVAKFKNGVLKRNLVLVFLLICSYLLTFDLGILNSIATFGTTKYFSPQARVWEFLVGVLLAMNSNMFPILHPNLKRKIRSVIYTCLLVFGLFFDLNQIGNMPWLMVPVILTGFFLVCNETSNEQRISRVDDSFVFNHVFKHLGDISYSLYLWHLPVYVSIKIVKPEGGVAIGIISLILTYTLAYLTFKWIETPLNLGYFVKISSWFIFLITGQLVLIASIVSLYLFSAYGLNASWSLNSHAVIQRGCDSGDFLAEKCVWGDSDSNNSIVIVGDSMAWAIADSFIQYAESKKLRLFALTRNGCPFTMSKLDLDERCTEWNLSLFNEIGRINPKFVVIANSDSYSNSILLGMGRGIEVLNQNKVSVVFVLPPPGGDDYSARRSVAFRPGESDRTLLPPKGQGLYPFGLVNYQSVDSFFVYNPADYLCTSSCLVAKNGDDFYNYGRHLSVYANNFLFPSIQILSNKVIKH